MLLCFALAASAQYNINGTVSSEGKGIVTTVFIPELNKGTTSDSSGVFRLAEIPKGYYTLEIKSIGHKPLLQVLQVPVNVAKTYPAGIAVSQDNNIIIVTASLEKTPIVMNEIVVSGASSNVYGRNTQPVELVDMNGVRERGQLTVMEALAARPGISLVSTGPGIARPVIRGMTGNRIVTVINGVKLENQQWDLEHTLGLNQYGIDRIEVIKGPASLLYGSDAMGGVLNFIDERPASVNTIAGDISAGFNTNTFGTVTDVGVKGAKEHINWSLRAGLNNHSDYYVGDFGKDDRVANSRFREFLGKATLGLNYKRSVTLFSYQLNMGYYGIVEPFEVNDTTGKEEEDHPFEFENPYHTLLHHTALVKNTLLLGSTKLITTASYQNDQRKELEPGDTESNPFLGFNLNVASLDIRADHAFSNSISLILGAQGTYQQNTNDGYSRLIPDYNQTDWAAYLLNRYRLANSKLNIDLGVRYDQRTISSTTYGMVDSADYMPALNRSFNNTSASIGINYTLVQNLNLYVNVGTGYRAPNLAELTSNGIRLETQRYELGNASFAKETNQQAEFGFVAAFRDLSLEGSVFYNNISNYIYMQKRGDTLKAMPVYTFRQGNAWIYGGEARVSIHPASLSWLNVSSAYSMLEGHLSDGNYLTLMPANKLNNELTLKGNVFAAVSNSFVRAGYMYVFAQNNAGVNELTTPAYQVVNLSFGGDIVVLKHTVMLSLGVNNLLNERYYDHLSRLRPFGVYNIGLNGFINLKIPFLWKD